MFHTGFVDFPLFNAIWFLLLPLSALSAVLLARFCGSRQRLAILPAVVLAGLGILSSLYCVVFYRDSSVGGYRFLFLVPPVVFASAICCGSGYLILHSCYANARFFKTLSIAAVFSVLCIALYNHVQFFSYLQARSTQTAYSSKLGELCPALEALPANTRIAFVSPLQTNEVFFGDTVVDFWVQRPSEYGYDSVHCRYKNPIPFIKTPGGLKQVAETPWIDPSESRNFDLLIFQARYGDTAQHKNDPAGDVLTRKLVEAFDELEAATGAVQIDRARCTFVAGSAWYRFALCPQLPAAP